MIFAGILETTTTTGTGDLTTSAVTGRPRFTDFFAPNATESSADPFYYAITTQDSPPQFLEIGIGYCSDAGALKRSQVIATYASGAFAHFGSAATLAAGTKNVICTGEAASFAPGIHDMAALGGSYALRAAGPPHLSVSASSASIAKNRLYYTPIYLDVARRVNSLKISTGGTAGVGGTYGVHIGLYAALRTGGPGRKLAESGDLFPAAYAIASYSFSELRLPPGWYYGACVHDFATTAQTFYLSGANTIVGGQTPLGWSSGAGISPVAGCYETLTAGWSSMPAAAAAAGSLSVMNSGVPIVILGLE